MAADRSVRKDRSSKAKDVLSDLRNVGPVARKNFHLLGIETLEQLTEEDADDLYGKLSAILGERSDPCVHDVFSATIHQARTGEALPWWHFWDARKQRQKAGNFPKSIDH
ncbi:MAG: helix-hairpin-helix domain-containing protein [Octadecabacter sp.]|nr:helix-hairpin-helix domain-containing protein [Octadecabacter sp.]